MLKSLKVKFTLFIILCNIPLIILAGICLIRTAITIKTSITEVKQQSLSSILENIDHTLEKADTTIYTNYNIDFINDYKNAKLSPNGLFYFYQSVKKQLDSDAFANEAYISFFNYTPEEDYLILDQASSLSLHRQDFIDFIKSLSFPASRGSWRVLELGSETLLVHQYKIGNNILGFYVSLNKLIAAISQNKAADGFYFITDDQNSKLVTNSTEDEQQVTTFLSGSHNYQVLYETSEYGYRLHYLYFQQTFWKYASFSFYIVIIMIIFALLCIPFTLLFTNGFVFRPLKRLRYGLDQLQKNDFTYRMNNTLSSSEFNIISQSFNMMASRINNLQYEIKVREEEKRKAELSWLKHQINPHFLLNNINLIFTLASNPVNEKIQQLSKYLFDYMRYTLRVDKSTIPLSDEIHHLKDYLSILQINYPGRIMYNIHCEDSLNSYTVPTFILNTVLENSIHHGFPPEPQQLTIQIEFSLIIKDDKKYLYSMIFDNGPGYPEDIINQINHFDNFTDYFSSHIGLKNIKSRLSLLYGEHNLLRISNRSGGGAFTEINIPI
jgi:Predicted signal transduction protein with a C-terminal ATPase domain